MSSDLFDRPAMLFLPASRESAVARARQSAADIVVLDLEDAVRDEDKEAARQAATGGAERFEGQMIEQMHVDSARRLLARR